MNNIKIVTSTGVQARQKEIRTGAKRPDELDNHVNNYSDNNGDSPSTIDKRGDVNGQESNQDNKEVIEHNMSNCTEGFIQCTKQHGLPRLEELDPNTFVGRVLVAVRDQVPKGDAYNDIHCICNKLIYAAAARNYDALANLCMIMSVVWEDREEYFIAAATYYSCAFRNNY